MARPTLAGTVTDSATKTAKAVDPTRGRRMTITGTHGYRAPEVYERDYGKGADWWNVRLPCRRGPAAPLLPLAAPLLPLAHPSLTPRQPLTPR